MGELQVIDSIETLARKLRVSAAFCGPQGSIGVTMSPAVSRRLAQIIDGGGFQARTVERLEALQREKRELMASRAAWVAECQGHLEAARRLNARTRRRMILTAALWLATLIVVVVW